MNKQVIQQVGQVWEFEDSREIYTSKLLKITDRDDQYNTLHFEHGVEVSEKLAITGKIKFKPANDLEWLAVNANGVIGRLYYRKTEGGTVGCYATAGFEDYHSGNDVIVKRNELFGEAEMKPKMKVSYEKWKFTCAWEACQHYELNGEVYIKAGDGYVLADIYQVVGNFENLYREVETPVTWQSVLEEFFTNPSEVRGEAFAEFKMFNDGGELTESEFIAMCHLVASMTDKPE